MSRGASLESLYAGYQSLQQHLHRVMSTSLNHIMLMQGKLAIEYKTGT